MLEEIAQIASDKAVEIAEQELKKFKMDNLEIELDEDIKKLVTERAISQMTFHLNHMHATEGEDLKEQFDSWFTGTEEDELRKSCYRCIKEEAAKRKKDADDSNLSFLDRYLKEHKRR